jgi:hypothetical protein
VPEKGALKVGGACVRLDGCRAALSRRRRADEQSEKDRRVRELLEAAVRILAGGGIARGG